MGRHPAVILFALVLPCLSCEDDEHLDSALGALTVAPEVVDFGPVWIGDRAQREPVFRNEGRAPVTLTTAGLPAPFDGPASVTIAAAGERKVPIGFRPGEAGEVEREVTYSSDGGQSVVFSVRGRGVPVDLVVEEELDFGPVGVGTLQERPLVVRNEAPLGITDFRSLLSGEDADAFSVVRGLRQVPAHGTAELALGFSPTHPGPQVAVLEVAACGGCEPSHVLLRGRGTDTDLSATPPSLEFGPVYPGNSRTLAVEVKNRGERVASLREARVEGAPFSVQAPGLPVDLARGGAVTLEVTFAPREVGDHEGRLSLVDDAGEVALEVILRGHGGGPVLVVSPEGIDFGRRAVGWRGAADVVLTNVGEDVPVEVVGAVLEGSAAWTVTPLAVPAPVGEAGVAVHVDFEGTAPGNAAATLVLTTTSPVQPEVHVPLAVEVVEHPGCTLVARPERIRFGLVNVGQTHRRTVSLVNEGTEPCVVWDLRMDPDGSMLFVLLDPPPDRELGPGEGMEVEVTFAPVTTGTSAIQTSAILYRTSNPQAPGGEVPVSAYAPGILLDAVPNPLDFGPVPLDRLPRRPISITTSQFVPPAIADIRLAEESSPDFLVLSEPVLPLTVGSEGVELTIAFWPGVVGPHRGLLEILPENAIEPLLVDLLGEALEPCGEACEPPVPVCPAPGEGVVNHLATLVGGGVDPNGDGVRCEWTVDGAPTGSSALPELPGECTTDFRPDIVGDYLLRLRVLDADFNFAECVTTYTARAPDSGLWVEMFWDVLGDVDLYLLHGDGGDPRLHGSWSHHGLVCYHSNCQPDRQTGLPRLAWDLPGPQDDPSLDRDCIGGTGPENIRIDVPTVDRDYHVGMMYFGMRNPARVTTNIYCRGQLAASELTDLTYDDQRVFLGTLRFDAAGVCTWTYEGLVLQPDGP